MSDLLNEVLKGGRGSGDWGHVGRAGKRGGSGGGGGKGKPRRGRRSREALNKEIEAGKKPQLSKLHIPKFAAPSAKLGTTSLRLVRSFNRTFSDSRGDTVNSKVLDVITKRSGVSENVVRRYISSWNTENVNSTELAMIRKSAVLALGATQSSYDRKKETKNDNTKLQSDYNKIAKAMYDETQEQLKEMKVTKVLLYRGINYVDNAPDVKVGGVATLKLNSLESWTLSPDMAEDFAVSSTVGTGFMMKSIIPADRIFSMPPSGLGTSAEKEMVVIGNGDDKVKISFKINN